MITQLLHLSLNQVDQDKVNNVFFQCLIYDDLFIRVHKATLLCYLRYLVAFKLRRFLRECWGLSSRKKQDLSLSMSELRLRLRLVGDLCAMPEDISCLIHQRI